jgi:hypothetical protein
MIDTCSSIGLVDPDEIVVVLNINFGYNAWHPVMF